MVWLRSAVRRLAQAFLCALLILGSASESRAFELYVGGDIGGSWVTGRSRATVPGLDVIAHGDASSLMGSVALGLAFNIGDVVPYELPHWLDRGTVRTDIAVRLGRGYTQQFSASTSMGQFDFDANVDNTSFMFNGWLDLPIYRRLYGYAGIGVGVASTDLFLRRSDPMDPDQVIPPADAVTFSYEASAGLGVQVAGRWFVTAGYRFADLGRPTLTSGLTSTTFATTLRAHEVVAGLRIDIETF